MNTKWPLFSLVRATALRSEFAAAGIDSSRPSFYDTPPFLTAEAANPKILDRYAELVEAQPYDPAYLQLARQRIRIAAEALRTAVEADGRNGMCVQVSGMLGRMLDRMEIWNYVAKATLTISFPPNSRLTPRHFWEFSRGEFVAPHAIVVAPPFGVIDITVRHQAYETRETRYLPPAVYADSFDLAKWRDEDLSGPELLLELERRGSSLRTYMAANRPHLIETIMRLPPRIAMQKGCAFKYVILATGGTAESLDEIDKPSIAGRLASEIFRDDVLPNIRGLV